MNLNSSSDTMFLVLQWAMQDRIAMLDAVNTETEKREVEKEIRAIERLRKRLFGDRKTKMEALTENAVPVTLRQLQALAQEGRIPVHTDTEQSDDQS